MKTGRLAFRDSCSPDGSVEPGEVGTGSALSDTGIPAALRIVKKKIAIFFFFFYNSFGKKIRVCFTNRFGRMSFRKIKV